VHRPTGRVTARSNYGGDGCHAVSWSADGLRIGYGAGAIGGTGGGYVLSATPEGEVLPPIAKYKFSPYDVPHTPRFCDRIHLPASDPLLRMVPREHVRELFEAEPETETELTG
jgi:hypothetical protein